MDSKALRDVAAGMADDNMPIRERFAFLWWYTDIIDLNVIAGALGITTRTVQAFFGDIMDEYKRAHASRYGEAMWADKVNRVWLTTGELPRWATSGEMGFVAGFRTPAEREQIKESVKLFAADRKKRRH